jgi:RNA polymerase sigma-70 factor (ECF subfamily)
MTTATVINSKNKKTVQTSMQQDMMSDETILAMLNKDATFNKGFSLLLRKYQERLYWHIRRMVVEHEDANDVLQNTCIKIYKGIGKFKGNSQLYTWLYRIASNEAITYLKKQQRLKSTSLSDEETNLENKLKADAFFDGDEIQRKLQAAIQTLPEKQRLVFNMRYFDEMSYKDISASLNTSVGALKASYHHAVKKIETYLKGEE